MQKLLGILGLIILIALASKYSRTIYMPLLRKTMPKETVSSISVKIETQVKERLQEELQRIGLEDFPTNITFLAFKEEQSLWAYTLLNGEYRLIKKYPFTAYSGSLGPKLKEGDRQIPEGIYRIEYLNPNSSFHLSMKIDYPNKFDSLKASIDGRQQLGSDIFIHGKNVTIGCIPVGDKAIEELFILAAHAFHTEIKVIISPRDFRANEIEPHMNHIEWEKELYSSIKEELAVFPR